MDIAARHTTGSSHTVATSWPHPQHTIIPTCTLATTTPCGLLHRGPTWHCSPHLTSPNCSPRHHMAQFTPHGLPATAPHGRRLNAAPCAWLTAPHSTTWPTTHHGPPHLIMVPHSRLLTTAPHGRLLTTAPHGRLLTTAPHGRLLTTAPHGRLLTTAPHAPHGRLLTTAPHGRLLTTAPHGQLLTTAPHGRLLTTAPHGRLHTTASHGRLHTTAPHGRLLTGTTWPFSLHAKPIAPYDWQLMPGCSARLGVRLPFEPKHVQGQTARAVCERLAVTS